MKGGGMKRFTVWLLAIALVLAPRFIFAADRGLHLGKMETDVRKTKIEAKKSAQEREKEIQGTKKKKKQAEKEAQKKKKELERKNKQAEKEAQKRQKR